MILAVCSKKSDTNPSPPARTDCDRDVDMLVYGFFTDYDIHGEIPSSLLKWLDCVPNLNPAGIALKAFIIIYIINDIPSISVLLFILKRCFHLLQSQNF